MGDLDVSGSTIEAAFDDHFLMEETLNRLLGAEPTPKDVNGIPGYSAFWIIGEAEYYPHTNSSNSWSPPHRLCSCSTYRTELDQRNLFANEHHAGPSLTGPRLSETLPIPPGHAIESYAAFRDGAWLLPMNDTANAGLFEQRAAAIKAAHKSTFSIHLARSTRWQTNASPYCPASPTPHSIPLSGRTRYQV